DQDALTCSAGDLPAGATLVPGVAYGSAVFTWTPTAADAGTHSVTFVVTDSLGNRDQQTVAIVARATNAAPVLLPVGDQTVAEGAVLHTQLIALDADGDALTFTATNLPPGVTLDRAAGMLTWNPNYFQAGRYAGIGLTVTDGAASSSETIVITVTATDQAPLLASIPPVGGQEQRLLRFSLVATDPDGDALVYAPIGTLPSGTFFDASNGLFEWTPGYDQAGDYTLRFAARDPQGAEDTVDVNVAIADVNRGPALVFTNHQVALGETLRFTVAATDPDSNETLVLGA